MNSPYLLSGGFLVMALIMTAETVYRLKKKDMSSSGVLVTPSSSPVGFSLAAIWRIVVCLGLYSLAVYALVRGSS
jgi:hypothetical protein